MIAFVKYILIAILAVVSVLSSAEMLSKIPHPIKAILEWWESKPYMTWQFYALFVVWMAMVAVTVFEDVTSGREAAELNRKIEGQNGMLAQQQKHLDQQSQSLGTQRQMLAEQQKMMYEQEKHISSVLFNMDTSLEGKERFLRSIRAFAHVASIESINTGFEGLVCDDGVALYWFDSNTDTITGFHFFSNSEINKVLSGTSAYGRYAANVGQIALGKDSEMAIAFRECLFRKLPTLPSDRTIKDLTRRQILQEMHTLLRYVYRAQGIDFRPIYDKEVGGELHGAFTGSYSLLFQYVVNPYAKIKRYNAVGCFDLDISKDFIDSLHGLTIAEFSEKVIERFRLARLEPKVRINDIRILENLRLSTEWQACSPFASRIMTLRED